MKRRSFVQLAAAAPPLAAALPTPAAAQESATAARQIDVTPADTVCDSRTTFFTPVQLATLSKLCDILVPKGKTPGALDAGVPQFLDFLVGASPAEVKQTYRSGLDLLDQKSRAKHSKGFAEITPAQAEPLLAALNAPWTYDPPRDPLARFLLQAKHDVHTATVNSREYAVAASAGRRGAAGIGQYWYPLD